MTVVTALLPQQGNSSPRMPNLTSAGLPSRPFETKRDLPSWAAFTADEHMLVVTVPTGTTWQRVEAAMAYGLFHTGAREGQPARDLVLVLPAVKSGERDGSTASRIRATALDKRITVWTHDGDVARPLPVMTRADALRALFDDPAAISNSFGNLRDAPRVERLTAWVRDRDELDIAHRPAYLAWHCGGRQVLQIKPGAKKTVVVAGSNAGAAFGHQPLTLTLTEGMTPAELEAVKVKVLEAVVDRLFVVDGAPKDNSHAEHRLQGAIATSVKALGWDRGLLRREFPVYRPGGGRGFIDFLRLDGDEVLHVVETKLGHDEMLVLQGVDYWLWATANRDALALVFNAGIQRIVVDFVVGKKDGAVCQPGDKLLSPYAAAHLELLDSGIKASVYQVHGWTPVPSMLTLSSAESVVG